MDQVARMTMVVIVGFVIAWVGSYVAFRWNHASPGGFVGKTTVIYPASRPELQRIYAPLADLDRYLTGTQPQIPGRGTGQTG